MSYLLKNRENLLRGGHLQIKGRLVNKSMLIGVFSAKTRVPVGLITQKSKRFSAGESGKIEEIREKGKSWLLMQNGEIYYSAISSRYHIKK